MHSADKHGKDVGEILGTDPVGVAATTSAEEILALDADCVVYSPLVPTTTRWPRCSAPARAW